MPGLWRALTRRRGLACRVRAAATLDARVLPASQARLQGIGRPHQQRRRVSEGHTAIAHEHGVVGPEAGVGQRRGSIQVEDGPTFRSDLFR